MSDYTLGVLSPLLGGFYFGSLLGGIHEVTRREGVRLIGIQTMAEQTGFTSLGFNYPLARSHIDGWIVIVDAVNNEFLNDLWQTGKPLVTISVRGAGIVCPEVLPDNYGGSLNAVRHLIAHGHRQIAFLGNINQEDIQQRYEGYKEALRECGIPFDEKLFFKANDNMQAGGNRAARQMLKAGLPCTAFLAGTDLNALGAIEMLKAGGKRIPEDIAVIGFDDIERAQTSEPTLTSVHQSFDAIGASAAELVLNQLRGNVVSAVPVYVPTILVERHSCGCLEKEISPLSKSKPGLPQNNEKSPKFLESVIKNSFRMNMAVLLQAVEDHKDISWLRWSPVLWACLGLWSTSEKDILNGKCNALVIDRTFRVGEDPLPPLNSSYTLSQFPPSEVFSVPSFQSGENLLALLPIKAPARDWGFLAIVGPIEMRLLSDEGMMGEWAELLSAVLEREVIFLDLRRQQRELEAHVAELILAQTASDNKNVSSSSTPLPDMDKLTDTFHELRAGLNVVTATIESLVEGVAGALPEKANTNLVIVARTSRKLATLVNEIIEAT